MVLVDGVLIDGDIAGLAGDVGCNGVVSGYGAQGWQIGVQLCGWVDWSG